MALSPEQVKELKKQLSEQIQNIPQDQKAQAQQQIDTMSPEALESMVKQQQGQQPAQPQKGIFRMIVDGDIPAKKIEENDDTIAVISKRAISKGHILIIPKKPAENDKSIPKTAFTLANKIAKKIESKLKAKSTEIQTESAFGEAVINIELTWLNGGLRPRIN